MIKEMNLQSIINRFKNSRNIQEKRKLKPILENISSNGYKSSQIYASYGEDSAAIQLTPTSKDLILLTTDALLPAFIEKTPYGAGFSAIYVGIDDIIACGGTPLASSITIAYKDEKIGKEILSGVLEATNVFKTPLIRGHTTTDSPSLAISSTIIGTIKVDHFLSAGGSNSGDFLAVVWDPEGKTSHVNKNYWNTITMKTSEEFYHKRSFISPAIENKYITACKDISNGGILGTLFQMMQFAKLGAEIDLKKLESQILSDNLQFSTEEFIFLFLTSGFLISGKNETKDEFIELVQKANMNFYEMGKVHGNDQIRLKYGKDEEILLDDYI
jgi:hypothetical protein